MSAFGDARVSINGKSAELVEVTIDASELDITWPLSRPHRFAAVTLGNRTPWARVDDGPWFRRCVIDGKTYPILRIDVTRRDPWHGPFASSAMYDVDIVVDALLGNAEMATRVGSFRSVTLRTDKQPIVSMTASNEATR